MGKRRLIRFGKDEIKTIPSSSSLSQRINKYIRKAKEMRNRRLRRLEKHLKVHSLLMKNEYLCTTIKKEKNNRSGIIDIIAKGFKIYKPIKILAS